MTDGIEVLTHSSIRISCAAGMVYADPFKVEGTPKDADYILITHDHFDHFSPEDIQRVAGPDTPWRFRRICWRRRRRRPGRW